MVQRATGKVLWQRTRVGLNVGLVSAALTVLAGVSSLGVVTVVGLAGFVIGNIVAFYFHQAGRAHRGGKSWRAALWSTVRNEKGFWGGQVAHIGVALSVVAIATTSVLAIRTEVSLALGETEASQGCSRHRTSALRRSCQR